MIRVVHTACALLLVAAALIAYGFKEEVRALRAQKETLEERREAALAALDTARAEWRHLNDPEQLRRAATRLYGPGRLVDADGGQLAVPRPDQIVSLRNPREAEE